MSIMKCSGVGCPLKKACYRFLMKAPYWTEFGVWRYNPETKSCTGMIKNGGKA